MDVVSERGLVGQCSDSLVANGLCMGVVGHNAGSCEVNVNEKASSLLEVRVCQRSGFHAVGNHGHKDCVVDPELPSYAQPCVPPKVMEGLESFLALASWVVTSVLLEESDLSLAYLA